MSVVSYQVNRNGTVNFYVKGGNAGSVNKDHVNYEAVLNVLRNAEKNREGSEKVQKRLNKLLDTLGVVKAKFNSISVHDNKVSYNGQPLRGVVVDRILELSKDGGTGYGQFCLFLDKVMQNPDPESREALFDWLDVAGLIVTAEGDILGYKGVRDDYRDCHSGTFDNSVGKVCSMDRSKVDNNRNNGCSRGLHVGSLEYARGFGQRTMVVKVNPKDVVSVPKDEGCQKMRVCEYLVIDELKDTTQRLNQINYTVDDSEYDNDDEDDDIVDECDDCGGDPDDCGGGCDTYKDEDESGWW